jgi:deoxyribose-phosphate aldolase
MKINQFIDHTLLKPEATEEQIDQTIQEARDYKFYSVMVNPYWVKHVHEKLKGTEVKTATVIGFPLGANTTAIKVAEAKQAIQDGADEIDMVENIGELKAGHLDKLRGDIEAVVKVAHNSHKLIKVIIETALLTDEEMTTAAKIVASAKADFVKTSTGFSTRGASVRDVEIIKKAIGDKIKIKAAGGIHTAAEADAMIQAGASRLGTSSSIKILETAKAR